jgi:hypothetical protein
VNPDLAVKAATEKVAPAPDLTDRRRVAAERRKPGRPASSPKDAPKD